MRATQKIILCGMALLIGAAHHTAQARPMPGGYAKAVPVNLTTQRERDCLARNIYHEARGELKDHGEIALHAVAEVTLNRVADSRWPDSICGVVYEWKQFSWTLKPQPEPEGFLWTVSKAIAKMQTTPGLFIEPVTDGANHYHADYIAKPDWAYGMTRTFKVGRHIFYRQD